MDLVGGPAVLLVLERFLRVGLGRFQHSRARIGRHRFAEGAEQAMDRLTHRLADEIPQRDVDRADGAHAAGALLAPQVDDDRFAMHRIPAHQHRLEMGDQPLARRSLPSSRRSPGTHCPRRRRRCGCAAARARSSRRSGCAGRMCVGGMSSQANSVRETSVIFIAFPPRPAALRRTGRFQHGSSHQTSSSRDR